jgi:hypothetical protein
LIRLRQTALHFQYSILPAFHYSLGYLSGHPAGDGIKACDESGLLAGKNFLTDNKIFHYIVNNLIENISNH